MGDSLQESMERLSLHDHVCLFHKNPEELIAFFHSAAGIANSEKYTGLRLCVDMSFALGKDVPRERFLEYQRKLSSFLSREKCLCMCLHGVTESPADMLLDALRAHPYAIHKGRLAANFYFVPLTGETGRIEAEPGSVSTSTSPSGSA